MQEVLAERLEAAVSALTQLDEVVHEHVGVSQGFLEAAVGRRREFFDRVCRLGGRVGLGAARQGQVCERVVFGARPWCQAG